MLNLAFGLKNNTGARQSKVQESTGQDRRSHQASRHELVCFGRHREGGDSVGVCREEVQVLMVMEAEIPDRVPVLGIHR